MHECEICEKSFVCEFDKHLHNAWIKKSRLSMIRKALLINSNKGGLGSTAFSILLSAKMKNMGYKVALMETAFSSDTPYYLNFSSENGLELFSNGIIPPVSKFEFPYIGPLLFMINQPQVVSWDDESILRFLKKMIINTDWGEVDLLIVDMPFSQTGLVKDVKSFLGDKLTNAVLMVDYKQANSPQAKAYVEYFEEFIDVMHVLLSPSKRKNDEQVQISGIKPEVTALPFVEDVYSADVKASQILDYIQKPYAIVLEEVSTACLGIF